MEKPISEEKAEELVSAVSELADQVKINADKSQRDRELVAGSRRTLRLQTVAVFVTVVLAAGLLIVGLQNYRSAHEIHDCVVPTGQCAQRSNANVASVVLSVQYRTENERLKTEIAVAQAKGDSIGVQVRQDRQKQVLADIAAVDQRLSDIQNRVDPNTDPKAQLPSP